MSSPHGSDHEDDAAFEEAAAKDAFGLSSFTSSSKGKATKDGKASTSKAKAADAVKSVRPGLVTNPDVLTEVSGLLWLHQGIALTLHSEFLAGLVEALNLAHHAAHRYAYEYQSLLRRYD